MVRKLIVTFLYEGIIEWYLRIPMIKMLRKIRIRLKISTLNIS